MKEITPNINPEVPLPAGAHFVRDWRYDPDSGGDFRFFEGTMRGIDEFDDVRGDIVGTQDRDGTVIERWINIYVNIAADSATARRYAADLLAAADEIDELNEVDQASTARGRWTSSR